MKASRTIVTALTLLFVVGILSVSLEAAPAIQGRKQEAKAPAVKAPSIPKEVAAIIQEGLATRQGRQDIPFSFFRQLVLPAQGQNLYPIFFFKAKNGDIGYMPSAMDTGEMEATLNVFFQFFRETETGALAPEVTGRAVGALKTGGADYTPENEDWYSFAVTMPAGKFTLALVLTSPDMKKMSVAYCDVNLPKPEVYEAALWATDPVIVNSLEQVEPDQRPTLHRGFFSWGAIKVVPNILGEIASGENLEIFFFVLGGAPKDPAAVRPLNDFEVNFEVQHEDGKAAIKWAPQPYEAYFINQPLPLVQTLQKMDEKGTVLGTERKPLDAGKYNLAISIADKVSGKKGETKLGFSVK
jgi:hypothetical protein